MRRRSLGFGGAILFKNFSIQSVPNFGKYVIIIESKQRKEYDEQTECAHPNTMELIAYVGASKLAEMRIYSVGGAAFRVEGRKDTEGVSIYSLRTMMRLRAYYEKKNMRLYDYVFACEDEEIKAYFLLDSRKISFDLAVQMIYETGKDRLFPIMKRWRVA